MTAKTLTDDQMAQLGRMASQQLTAAAQAWELGMTCLRLDSREYRALCAAGRVAERSYYALWLSAEKRGWTREQSDAVFTVRVAYGWG